MNKKKNGKRIHNNSIRYTILSLIHIWAAAASMTAVGAALTFLYYYRMAKKEFGGITGDLAGYFLQVCELVLTAVLAAVTRFAI